MSEIKDKLIAAGVKNLQAFGYPGCNKENILTDQVYKSFFCFDAQGKQRKRQGY